MTLNHLQLSLKASRRELKDMKDQRGRKSEVNELLLTKGHTAAPVTQKTNVRVGE